ncbi:unnamed protein product [marine sediment metagenome]|uniref:Uncharacterized protein n=1 Tax=marine sediment metagenome TaxID=412755 RepID=X1MEW1_9ZZZZ
MNRVIAVLVHAGLEKSTEHGFTINLWYQGYDDISNLRENWAWKIKNKPTRNGPILCIWASNLTIEERTQLADLDADMSRLSDVHFRFVGAREWVVGWEEYIKEKAEQLGGGEIQCAIHGRPRPDVFGVGVYRSPREVGLTHGPFQTLQEALDISPEKPGSVIVRLADLLESDQIVKPRQESLQAILYRWKSGKAIWVKEEKEDPNDIIQLTEKGWIGATRAQLEEITELKRKLGRLSHQLIHHHTVNDDSDGGIERWGEVCQLCKKANDEDDEGSPSCSIEVSAEKWSELLQAHQSKITRLQTCTS